MKPFFLLLWLASAAAAESSVTVIVNPASPIKEITRGDLIKIFSGRITRLEGNAVTPRDQAPGPVKERFYQSYFGFSLAEIHDYWIREVYRGSGRKPPGHRETADDATMRAWVAKTPGAIGYLDQSAVDPSVRAVPVR